MLCTDSSLDNIVCDDAMLRGAEVSSVSPCFVSAETLSRAVANDISEVCEALPGVTIVDVSESAPRIIGSGVAMFWLSSLFTEAANKVSGNR